MVVALAIAALGAVASSGAGELVRRFTELTEALRQPKEPEPVEVRDDPLLWREYGRIEPRKFEKQCRHCGEPIRVNEVYNQEPSGPFNGGLPFYSHPVCAQRALAGLN